MSIIKYAAAAVLLSMPAMAQTNGTYLLTSSNSVSPSSPTTTIGIWATWDDPGADFVFGGADYDLAAGDGVFSNPVNVLNGPGSSTGAIAGNQISGGHNGAVFIPQPPWFLSPRDNPILLATYDWTTADFTPRTVALQTSSTSVFMVGELSSGRVVDLYPHEFTPGTGVITVVPAPAAWFVLALPFVAARRRRRC